MRVRTTNRPDQVLEVDGQQLAELRALGLVAEVLDDTAPEPATASSQPRPGAPDFAMGASLQTDTSAGTEAK
ncbi:MAG TPA: hypothetical protein VGF65_02975 [Mycobacterium sp.]|jgi:hypothetical protein